MSHSINASFLFRQVQIKDTLIALFSMTMLKSTKANQDEVYQSPISWEITVGPKMLCVGLTRSLHTDCCCLENRTEKEVCQSTKRKDKNFHRSFVFIRKRQVGLLRSQYQSCSVRIWRKQMLYTPRGKIMCPFENNHLRLVSGTEILQEVTAVMSPLFLLFVRPDILSSLNRSSYSLASRA